MIRGMWTLASLDLLLWRRMPMAIASALIPPVGMTALLVVLSMAVTQQPVALVVEGRGSNTEKMASIIQSDDDAYLLTKTDMQTADRMLADQEVAAVIIVPKDFDDQVNSLGVANVILKLNNVDIDFADDIRRSVDRSVAQFDAPSYSLEGEKGGEAGEGGGAPANSDEKAKPDEGAKPEGAGKESGDTSEAQSAKPDPTAAENPYLVNIKETDLRETNVEWLNYQVVPALVLLVLSVGLMGTALLCAQDIERKTARYLVLTPQDSWTLVAGRLLGGFIASILFLIPAIGWCVWTKTINPPPSHWPALLAIFAATALCASGLGAILGTALTGSRTIALASSVISTYLFFLGGGFTNIAFLPQWMRTLSSFIPTRYAIDGMRQALFYSTLDGVGKDLAILCATAILMCAIGSFSVRRSWVASE